MIFESIKLKHIRKFESFEFRPESSGLEGSQKVLIVGRNGSGKTTILESLIFLFRGYLFGSSSQRFIRKGENFGCIEALFLTGEKKEKTKINVRHRVTAVIDRTKGLKILMDGKEVSREAVRNFGDAYWFFPQDILIILGGEEERRDYVDNIGRYIFPNYSNILKEYAELIKSRNHLLTGHLSQSNHHQLDIVEELLSKTGEKIINSRIKIIKKLNEELMKSSHFLFKKGLRIVYKPSFTLNESVYQSLVESFFVSRETDIRTGSTSVGPHRDKILINFDGRDARYEASYGEKKLVALLLKLAAYRVIKETSDKDLTFFADDLFSELDSQRKIQAFNLLKENCAGLWITTTEPLEDLKVNDEFMLLNLD